MREEQHPLGCLRTEAREEVAQVERIAAVGDVTNFLDDDRIRARAQRGEEPVARLLVSGLVRDARPERHLLLHVRERGTTVERPPSPPRSGTVAGARLTGGQQHRHDEPQPTEWDHRI